MVKINRKTYRKKKLEWFKENSELRKKEYRQRKREFDLFRLRAQLDMELTNLRITEVKTEHAINKVKANEMDAEKLKEWKKANEEKKKNQKKPE